MKKILYYSFIFAMCIGRIHAQNIAINTSGSSAAMGSGLDIDFTDKGLLIPRVSLTGNADLMGNASLPTSLIIYKKDVVGWAAAIGFYYWDGSIWQPMLTATTSGWALLGNASTVDGTNFLGTTDAVPFNLKVNNQKSGRIDLSGNAFFGYQTAMALSTGSNNTSVGFRALKSITTGTNNTGIGWSALGGAAVSSNNVGIGYNALQGNTYAEQNVAIGNEALGLQGTSGFVNGSVVWNSDNVAIGYKALYNSDHTSNTTGYRNTAVGSQALLTNTTGSGNTAIGYLANIATNNFTNATAIGANAYAGASNSLILGGINGTNGATADTKVGIRTTTPNTSLDVNGSVAWREGTALSLANGNNDNIALGTSSFYRITGPTATYTVTGFTGGADGRILTIYNTTSQIMCLANDVVSTAANCIYTLTGSNFKTAVGPGVVTLQYNANVSRWLVVSRQDKSTVTTAGIGPSLLYPDGTNYSATKFVDFGTTDYTVPANTTLYIMQFGAANGMKICVDGIVVAQANGAAKMNAPGVNSFSLAGPVVVGPGSVVRASTTADPGPYNSTGTPVYFSGFEVTASAITPVTSSMPSGTTYQVPTGKTLVVTNIYEIIGATISISSDNSTWIPFLIGPSNYATVSVAAPNPITPAALSSDFQLAQLLQPILVPPGYYIRSSDANAYRASFNGYLR